MQQVETANRSVNEINHRVYNRIGDGEILLSWSGNPDTSIDTFVWCGGPAWLNQHIFRVLPHQGIEKHFVFYLLKYLRPVFAEIARDKQTTGLGHFQPHEWLGDFIVKIRNASNTNGLSHAQADLSEIVAINDYSKKYHHDQNPGADSETLSEDELHGFVKRTLKLAGGC
ncbi:MAG: hypothetical protein OXC84_11030 [Gammaproteobacteria bacterium]|nr:hypothetical protein [Gammaproteobacteria bacterium]